MTLKSSATTLPGVLVSGTTHVFAPRRKGRYFRWLVRPNEVAKPRRVRLAVRFSHARLRVP